MMDWLAFRLLAGQVFAVNCTILESDCKKKLFLLNESCELKTDCVHDSCTEQGLSADVEHCFVCI